MGAINTEIWMLILQSGDWWTTQDVDRHFVFPAGASRKRLHEMEKNGALEKKPVQGTRSVKFAVTARCLVPRGITVGKAQVRKLAEEGSGTPGSTV
jgi:hypothetical protein